MRREVGEKTCTKCVELSCAARSTGSFGKHGEDWLGFILVVTRFDGTPKRTNPEDARKSVDLVRSARYRHEGDHHFPAADIDACLRPFHGVMPYKEGRMQSWSYTRC